jgi:hypothetical protein
MGNTTSQFELVLNFAFEYFAATCLGPLLSGAVRMSNVRASGGPAMSRQPWARQPLGWPIRCSFLVAAACLAGLLVVARKLEPDPRGFGTHTQLGLRNCAFLTVTGRLCPTCGMTTSFAWFYRGQLGRAWHANPAGCLYALLTIPFMAWLVWSALANEPVGFRSLSAPLAGILVTAVALGLASWLIRLIVSPGVMVEPEENLPAFARAAGL